MAHYYIFYLSVSLSQSLQSDCHNIFITLSLSYTSGISKMKEEIEIRWLQSMHVIWSCQQLLIIPCLITVQYKPYIQPSDKLFLEYSVKIYCGILNHKSNQFEKRILSIIRFFPHCTYLPELITNQNGISHILHSLFFFSILLNLVLHDNI